MHAATSLTYAEWAPLAPLTDSGLIRACAYFLTTQDFCLLACDILKQLSHRRQDKVRPPSSHINTAHVSSPQHVALCVCNHGDSGHGRWRPQHVHSNCVYLQYVAL